MSALDDYPWHGNGGDQWRAMRDEIDALRARAERAEADADRLADNLRTFHDRRCTPRKATPVPMEEWCTTCHYFDLHRDAVQQRGET